MAAARAASTLTPQERPVGVPGVSVSRQPKRPMPIPRAAAGAKTSPVDAR